MISSSTQPTPITLTAEDAAGSIRRFKLAADQGVFVGRSSNCGLQLPGEGIAEIHCRVGFEDGKLYVQDWMSSGGTRVNGKLIEAPEELKLGDLVQIGKQQISIGDASCEPAPSKSEPSACDADEAFPSQTVDHSSDHDQVAGEAEPFDPRQTSASQAGEASRLLSDADSGATDFADPPQSMELGADFFDFEEEETFDRETVELLRAEIEDLQAALAQRDAEGYSDRSEAVEAIDADQITDEVSQRMRELIDEANRSDERVALLEEMLHAAEESNRSQQEEHGQLEAWVGDIETRIGQREAEHQAEVEALRERLEESNLQQDKLRQRLQQAACGGSAPKQYEETLEHLQRANRELQEKLSRSEQRCLSLEQRLDQASGEHDRVMREERASIAKEQAKISRMRFELSRKLTDIEELPKEDNQADKETAHRIRTLREHLREIHQQEKQEEREASLTTRLAKLWKRVEY